MMVEYERHTKSPVEDVEDKTRVYVEEEEFKYLIMNVRIPSTNRRTGWLFSPPCLISVIVNQIARLCSLRTRRSSLNHLLLLLLDLPF